MEFEPGEAAPGSVVDLVFFVEAERGDVGITEVDLRLPEGVDVPVVDTPAVEGWTATVVDNDDGTTSILWTGGPSTEDLNLPLRIGPLPSEPGRLQFKALETYADGEISRWIAEWPAGAPEPDEPGPVLDLVAGAAGEVPVTEAPITTSPSSAASPSTAATTTTSADDTAADETNVTADEQEDDDDNSAVPIVIAVLGVVALAAGGAWLLVRRRR